MYQNTISSAYPIVNPVQMQAPVTVNMPPQSQMPQVLQKFPMPQSAPIQMPTHLPERVEVPIEASPYGKDIFLRVNRVDDETLHVESALPKIMDGNTYYIKQNGTLAYHSGWTGMHTIVENCPVMADIYSRLASSLSLHEQTMQHTYR